MAALPRLTELTLIYPHPYATPTTETRTVHSATLELVNACRTLQDFDTLQIIHLLLGEAFLMGGYGLANLGSADKWDQGLRDQVKGAKDLAIDSLKKAEVEFREGGGRKKAVVRVIELYPHHHPPGHRLSSVKAKEFEV